ncbi:Calx-beta domain-containing protein [Paludisphaera rhizosphaerae]|uniref:Calx-beta domain-containing protein n=1 Tax=Paludisphaera rhizosphaerae TaxID=2711216 RepID=UPI0013EDB80D|nr:Calx-beta domain-containing protein [Paludisphaera rhizosphaerae]
MSRFWNGRQAKLRPRFVVECVELERRELMAYAPTVAAYQVNQVLTGGQYQARTTVGPDGVTTIVWEDYGLDGDGYGIYARRLDAAGKPLGDQFRVNTTTVGNQMFPRIGSDAQGDVLISWKDTQANPSGLVQFYQRYDATGAKVGGNVALPGTVEYADDYDMQVAPDGGFTLIQQQSYQTSYRRFDATGSLVVDASIPRADDAWAYRNNSVHPFPTARTTGGVSVMAWMDVRTRAISNLVSKYDGRGMIRLIGPDGQQIGADINLIEVDDAISFFDAVGMTPEVTPLADGGFLATWYVYSNTYPQKYSLVGRRFDAAGVPQGSQITFFPMTTDDDLGTVAQLKNGNLVEVTIKRVGKTDSVDYQILDVNGNPLTGRIAMPDLPGTTRSLLRVAPTSGSGFQVSWGVSGLDQSLGEVYLQAFADLPSVGFKTTDVRLGEGSGVATIQVVRGGDASSAASVAYQTTSETATAGADYTSVAGVLTFAAGQSSAYINVPILRDALAEKDETFLVQLSNPSGLALSQSSSLRVTIVDDPQGTAGPALPNIYFDRGSAGLWAWTAGVGLAKINGADPEGVAVGRDGVVYVDYGVNGLWRWAGGAMTQIIAANPENILAAPDGSLYVDFGRFGLWRRDGSGLKLINGADPEGFAAAPDGTLYVDFGRFGLWRRDGSGLKLINGANPESMVVASDGTLYVDFGSFGLWRRDGSGLKQILAANPESLAAASDGSVFVDFGSFGLWHYVYGSGFTQINKTNPEAMAAAPDGSLYVDFGGSGLWSWTSATGLTQINAANPESLAVARDGLLYVDFGPTGVWRRLPSGAFERIDPTDPQSIAV